MTDVDLQLVREFFELNLFRVTTNWRQHGTAGETGEVGLQLYVENTKPACGEAVDVVLAPGQMSLHHGRMFHASGPNASARRRVGVAVRYIAPHVRQVVGPRAYAALVRGADRSGHFVPVPSPAADFAPAALSFHAQSPPPHNRAVVNTPLYHSPK